MKTTKRNKKHKWWDRKNKYGKIPLIILTLLCLCGVTYGIYSSYSAKNELAKFPEFTIATIDQKYRIRSRGYYINYIYKVDGQKYRGSKKLNKIELELVNVGDQFKVVYSGNNPEYSRISFENRIEK